MDKLTLGLTMAVAVALEMGLVLVAWEVLRTRRRQLVVHRQVNLLAPHNRARDSLNRDKDRTTDQIP
jgi:hypothetical protein